MYTNFDTQENNSFDKKRRSRKYQKGIRKSKLTRQKNDVIFKQKEGKSGFHSMLVYKSSSYVPKNEKNSFKHFKSSRYPNTLKQSIEIKKIKGPSQSGAMILKNGNFDSKFLKPSEKLRSQGSFHDKSKSKGGKIRHSQIVKVKKHKKHRNIQNSLKTSQFSHLRSISAAKLRIPNYVKFSVPESGRIFTLDFTNCKLVGNGSFGIVYLARISETSQIVAIKKVFQDQRFKNRELGISKSVQGNLNIVRLIHSFYQNQENKKVYLNLVMEYLPGTVYSICKKYKNNSSFVPWIYIKLFGYQILRSLNYIHSLGICHRDVKPQNLLIDSRRGILKLCDFGSAKKLNKGDLNVSYICSRYYRAPELIFGEQKYTHAVDSWSTGCVIAEMVKGRPIFPGESSVDQLVKIIKVLGTPSKNDISSMNEKYEKLKFPIVKGMKWNYCFRERMKFCKGIKRYNSSLHDGDGDVDMDFKQSHQFDSKVIDLLTLLLKYNPRVRMSCIDALGHPFFDDLRDKNTKLPNGSSLPYDHLFDFSQRELRMSNDKNIFKKLVPSFYNINTK